MNKKALKYDDIQLVPEYSDVVSRSLVDTSVEFLGRRFKLPIIPANMQDVINLKLSKWFSENGYFYIMHRFNVCIIDFVYIANKENWKTISISVGVNEDSLSSLEILRGKNLRIDYITIDVAHGHHLKVRNRIEYLKTNFPNTKIIAGNIASFSAAYDLQKWGADAIKVGIGGGSICSTRFQTGFHVPMFSCVRDICDADITIPVIADGGIKHFGDIAKAINAGATMVMSGGLFASCIDSPAAIINGKKRYNGSTSLVSKNGENNHIEGISLLMDSGDTIEEKLNNIKMALQSSCSYAGGIDITSLREVDYIEV